MGGGKQNPNQKTNLARLVLSGEIGYGPPVFSEDGFTSGSQAKGRSLAAEIVLEGLFLHTSHMRSGGPPYAIRRPHQVHYRATFCPTPSSCCTTPQWHTRWTTTLWSRWAVEEGEGGSGSSKAPNITGQFSRTGRT